MSFPASVECLSGLAEVLFPLAQSREDEASTSVVTESRRSFRNAFRYPFTTHRQAQLMHRARNFTPASFAQSRASAKQNKRKRRPRLSESKQHETHATTLDHSSGQGEQVTDQLPDFRTRIEPEPCARTSATRVLVSEAPVMQSELTSRVAELEALVESIRYNTSDPQMTIVPMLGQAEGTIAASRDIPSAPRAGSDPCVEATLHSRTSGDTYYIGKTAWTGIHHDVSLASQWLNDPLT